MLLRFVFAPAASVPFADNPAIVTPLARVYLTPTSFAFTLVPDSLFEPTPTVQPAIDQLTPTDDKSSVAP